LISRKRQQVTRIWQAAQRSRFYGETMRTTTNVSPTLSKYVRWVIVTTMLAGCTEPIVQPDVIALPGDAYYPESLIADADGTLYVSSLVTGQVVAFTDGSTSGKVVVAASSGLTGIAGVTVRGEELWLCSVDTTFQRPSEVRSFTLDGVARTTTSLGANRFCNDLAFDAAGTLYVTDSFSGTVLRLSPGGTALEPWVVDAKLAPAMPGGFGLDGLAVVSGAVFVSKFDTGGFFRIAIGAGGAAGAVQPITVTPALVAPDGIRALDERTLLVAEGNGRLTKVTIDGATATATALATGLDQPTGVTVARGSAWVAEGQLGRLFAMPSQAPNLPFSIRRIDL
jgi:sugar lactone lactonase YvrE